MSESTSPTTSAAGVAPAEQSVSIAPVSAAPPTPKRPARRSANRLLLINGGGLLALLMVGLGLYYLWHQSYYFYKTDDAQVSAPTAHVAPLARYSPK